MRDRDAYDEAVALRTWINVAWFAGAGLGAASAAIVLLAPSRTDRAGRASSAQLSVEGPTVSARFRY